MKIDEEIALIFARDDACGVTFPHAELLRRSGSEIERLRDWPTMNMKPLGAAKVTVIDGEGLDLLAPATAE